MGIFVVFGAILFNMNSFGEFHLANQAVPSEKEIIDFWHSEVAPGSVPPAFIDYCKTFPSGEPIDRITFDRFKVVEFRSAGKDSSLNRNGLMVLEDEDKDNYVELADLYGPLGKDGPKYSLVFNQQQQSFDILDHDHYRFTLMARNVTDLRKLFQESRISLDQKLPEAARHAGEGSLTALKALPRDRLVERDAERRSALWYALTYGRKDCVEFLLQRGLSVDDCHGEYHSPILHDISAEMTQAISSANVNWHIKGAFGKNALWDCTSIQKARILVAKGLDPNGKDQYGDTLLTDTTVRVDTRFLLDIGCDPNQLDGNGNLPLIVHIKDGGVIRWLLNAGADPKKKDGNGVDALTVLEMYPIGKLAYDDWMKEKAKRQSLPADRE